MKQDKTKKQVGGRLFNAEIEYYQQDWHDYYHPIIRLVPSNSFVLDIGCGRGGLLEYLRDKKNCRVAGVDMSDDAIRILKKKGIEAIKADVEEDDIPGSYDVIILAAVLEHLIDPLSVLSKLRNNLKNDQGCIIIGVPNFSEIIARIQYLFGKNVTRFGNSEADKKLGIQPPGHIQFFNKSTLSHVLKKAGYKPLEWSYHSLPPLRKSKVPLYKLPPAWIIHKLYTIDHELFSGFIAVTALKK